MSYIEFLADAIRKLHGCPATYVETIPVSETFNGQIVWQGKVEVFQLVGHPQASFCYAWGFENDSGEMKAVTVLALPPVDSALKAVQVFIASTVRGSNAEN
jgi:hypothetical protein